MDLDTVAKSVFPGMFQLFGPNNGCRKTIPKNEGEREREREKAKKRVSKNEMKKMFTGGGKQRCFPVDECCKAESLRSDRETESLKFVEFQSVCA